MNAFDPKAVRLIANATTPVILFGIALDEARRRARRPSPVEIVAEDLRAALFALVGWGALAAYGTVVPATVPRRLVQHEPHPRTVGVDPSRRG